VTWTAAATGLGATPVYQFSVTPIGGLPHVVRDFSPSNSFTWNPMQEGSYEIGVVVKSSFGAAGSQASVASYHAESRVSGSQAVVSPTSNPLVALFSAPPSFGHSMVVQFKPLRSSQPWHSTAALPIVPGVSTNFLVAGMLPNKIYLMRSVVDGRKASAALAFRTGFLPRNMAFPTFTVQKAPTSRTELTRNMVFHVGINPPAGTVDTLATDLTGHVLWYYDPVANAFPSFATSVVPGGSVLLLGGVQNGFGGATVMREVDLASDTLRETNVDALNAELAALGQHSITFINHDAQRLPNGGTAILATTPRVVNLHGRPTLYTGDMVIVLDANFQVAWVWDPFTWLDPNRLPTLGEGPGDWTHANSVAWSPADGNLIVSMRSQDWVIKIDYANGTGNGHVIWRLGAGGDFILRSNAVAGWFSHQHDVRYMNGTTLVVFDDGNIRRATNPKANSRGQELVLNERTMQARLVANVDLGVYASALGSAQRLRNGNLDFNAGFSEQTIEVQPGGAKTYVLKMNMPGEQYRSYIYSNLYGISG
jgi:hypothetical protein